MERRSQARSGFRRSGSESEDEANDQSAQEQESVVKQRTAISAQIVYEAILAEGEEELRRPSSALAFSGFAAGLSMGFSFLVQGLLQAQLPQHGWTPLISKLGYSIGFLIVILGRQQLFTENTLTPIIPLLKHKGWNTLWNTARLWGTVLVANWLGTIMVAWVLARSGIFDEATRGALVRIGSEAMGGAFWTTVLRGVFAGWLIALLVWLLPFAETGRVAVIILMTYVIALGSFAHVVAGSVDTFYLVASGLTSWGQYLFGFMVPTLLGNVLGGVALVAALNHAQVAAGTNHKE